MDTTVRQVSIYVNSVREILCNTMPAPLPFFGKLEEWNQGLDHPPGHEVDF